MLAKVYLYKKRFSIIINNVKYLIKLVELFQYFKMKLNCYFIFLIFVYMSNWFWYKKKLREKAVYKCKRSAQKLLATKLIGSTISV